MNMMRMETPPEFDGMDLWFIKWKSQQWLKAVIGQGNRVLSASARSRAGFEQPRELSFEDSRQWACTEEHFLVIAIGKSMDWVNELKSHDSGLQQPIDDYLRKIPTARDVRNMHEHDTEYFRGKGRKQSSFHQNVLGRPDMSADATATIILGPDYLIGGRLNVREAMIAAEELLEHSVFKDISTWG